MKKISVLFDPSHRMHAPRFEYDRGEQQPYQETARRADCVVEALQALNWVQLCPPLEEGEMPVEELYAIHDPALIAHLQESSRQAGQQEKSDPQVSPVYHVPWIFPIRSGLMNGLLYSSESSGCFAFDTYAPIGKGTWQAAISAARLAWQGAGLLLDGESLVYAICRPPGHHAGIDSIGGYCYLNNAALAASRLSATGPVAILDIDYHHGNGTQEIFWNNAQVLFVSIHADPLVEYPFFSGYVGEIGGADAVGTNYNIPLHKGCDDTTYLEAVDQAVEKIMVFKPRWLIISAGFDTSNMDPSTNFLLSDEAYEQIGIRLANLELPTLIVQEGGYAVEKNGELAVQLLKGLSIKVNE